MANGQPPPSPPESSSFNVHCNGVVQNDIYANSCISGLIQSKYTQSLSLSSLSLECNHFESSLFTLHDSSRKQCFLIHSMFSLSRIFVLIFSFISFSLPLKMFLSHLSTRLNKIETKHNHHFCYPSLYSIHSPTGKWWCPPNGNSGNSSRLPKPYPIPWNPWVSFWSSFLHSFMSCHFTWGIQIKTDIMSFFSLSLSIYSYITFLLNLQLLITHQPMLVSLHKSWPPLLPVTILGCHHHLWV